MSGRSQPSLLAGLPSASVLALLLACGADVFLVPGPRGPYFLSCLLAVVLVLGCLYGALWRLAFWLVSWLPRPLAYAAWLLSSSAVAARLAFSLGAMDRLDGTYTSLAIAVLVTCATGALMLSALLCSIQPVGPSRRAFLPERKKAARALVALTLGVVAVLLYVADRTLYVDLYAVAHVALRVGALSLFMFGAVLLHDSLWLPRLSRAALVVIAAALCFLLLTLDERQPQALQAFLLRPWPAMLLSAARDLTDVDRDGYASLLGGGDCAPFDPRVHPGAREVPNNGIDDNCTLGDARPRPPTRPAVPLPKKPSPMDVVLITVDSLRCDRVGVYAAACGRIEHRLTPNLDVWARTATVFQNAYSPGGWTSLALPALMRGVYPRRLHWTRFYETSSHRLLRNPLQPQLQPGETAAWLFAFPTFDAHLPLAQWLARRGMSTVAVVDDGRSEILRRGTGIEAGFQEYVEVNPGPSAAHDDATTATLAIGVLDVAAPPRRLFLWVHFFGVHSPSERHPSTPRYGATVADRYDHEVRYFDTQLQRLLDALDRRKVPTAVFLTADHGEELEQDVRHHGYSVKEEVIHVPLIARVPGWQNGRSEVLVSLVDLAPTILALTATPAPQGLDGADIQTLLAQPRPPARVLLSDTWRFDVHGQLVADFVAAFDGRNKLVLDELAYGSYRYDQRKPEAMPVAQFGATRDPLSKAAYGYLEETGGMPVPND